VVSVLFVVILSIMGLLYYRKKKEYVLLTRSYWVLFRS